MLKKSQRLTKAEFDHYFKTGKRIHSPTFQLIYSKDGDFHGASVVGKKVFKKAVARNRLRRQVYGALYRYAKENEVTGVFVLIAKPNAKDLTQKQVSPTVVELLEKVFN